MNESKTNVTNLNLGLSELPKYFRKRESYQHDQCAAFVEHALPVWTKITDDPDTWPKNGQAVLVHDVEDGDYIVAQASEHELIPIGPRAIAWNCIWDGLVYRPLCDLDYPPEKSND